jgi:hypothetical protein
VNPNGVATTAWFDWGITTNFSSSTGLQSLGSGSSNVSVSAALSGLANNRPYFFRIRATNLVGSNSGTNLSFAWNPARPILIAAIPSNNSPFRLTFNAASHQSYLVAASTNFSNWALIGSAADSGNGTFSFTDTNSSGFSRRFYRAVLP